MFPRNEARRPRAISPAGFLAAAAVLLVGLSASAQRGPAEVGEGFRSPYAWPELPEMVERADTIVAGEVLDMRASWSADRSEIFTTVIFRPDRRFKSGEQSLIRFRVPGGTVGDTRLMITHSPVFSVGERALVFLRGDSGRLPRVVAGEAGKRHIRVTEDGEQAILPGFAIPGTGTGEIEGLATLDDLTRAMPNLLAAAASR